MKIAISIILRDLKKNLSQKARLVASMIRPLLWLFIIGSGFNQIVDIENNGNYFSFLMPGLICMTALFTGVVSSMSIVYDKEFGFIRLLYLSPSFYHYFNCKNGICCFDRNYSYVNFFNNCSIIWFP